MFTSTPVEMGAGQRRERGYWLQRAERDKSRAERSESEGMRRPEQAREANEAGEDEVFPKGAAESQDNPRQEVLSSGDVLMGTVGEGTSEAGSQSREREVGHLEAN